MAAVCEQPGGDGSESDLFDAGPLVKESGFFDIALDADGYSLIANGA